MTGRPVVPIDVRFTLISLERIAFILKDILMPFRNHLAELVVHALLSCVRENEPKTCCVLPRLINRQTRELKVRLEYIIRFQSFVR